MITTRLMGGMGNQMFQYAFALSCARRLGTQVAMDATMLTHPGRAFSLGQWTMPLNLVPKSDPTVVERGLRYNQSVADNVKNGDVLQGYWQSEQYFSSVASELTRDVFLPYKSTFEHPLLPNIVGTNSVAVHIRRGDYLKEPHSTFHGNLPFSYYHGAMATVQSYACDVKFYVFSDDPTWCRQAFYNVRNLIVLEPGREGADIYLMSMCQHAIIANSSFSWWGAWLGDQRHSGRTVVAPKKWFSDTSGEDYSTIVPERWIKI